MKTSKLKSFVFGLAFLSSMGFGGITSKAQDDPILEGGCYQRMTICNGGYTAYHCDGRKTGSQCSTVEAGCYFC